VRGLGSGFVSTRVVTKDLGQRGSSRTRTHDSHERASTLEPKTCTSQWGQYGDRTRKPFVLEKHEKLSRGLDYATVACRIWGGGIRVSGVPRQRDNQGWRCRRNLSPECKYWGTSPIRKRKWARARDRPSKPFRYKSKTLQSILRLSTWRSCRKKVSI